MRRSEMKWYEKAEKIIGRDWWCFYCGMLATMDIYQAILIYELPRLFRILRDAGLV
jgi:hypothetical protein